MPIGPNEMPVNFKDVFLKALPYYHQTSTPAGILPLQDLEGRVLVIGQYMTTEPASPANIRRQYRVVLYEVPCSALVWDATEGAFKAQVPAYIDVSPTNGATVLFVPVEAATTTEDAIGLSPKTLP
jgi:hypothetical protein